MSIAPGSDLILDVVKAVDPGKSVAATAKLTKVAAVPVVTGKGFVEELGKSEGNVRAVTRSDKVADKIAVSSSEAMQHRDGTHGAKVNGALQKAYRQLEGVFLQGIIKSMMSGEKSKLFGDGIAGDYWKSFMAEAIAQQVSKGKGLGVADTLSQRPRGISVVGRSSAEMVLRNVKYEAELQKILLKKLERS